MSIIDDINLEINDCKNDTNNNIKRTIVDTNTIIPLKKSQKTSCRCNMCNKKLGLTSIQCKCEYYFCTTHKAPECHSCTFNYKNFGKKLIQKANPLIQSSQINKI